MLSPSLIFFNYLNGENECHCHDFPLILRKYFACFQVLITFYPLISLQVSTVIC